MLEEATSLALSDSASGLSEGERALVETDVALGPLFQKPRETAVPAGDVQYLRCRG
jgi:hypothetical protein